MNKKINWMKLILEVIRIIIASLSGAAAATMV